MTLGDPHKLVGTTWINMSTGLPLTAASPPPPTFPGAPPTGKMYYGAAFESGYSTIDQTEIQMGHPIGLEREYFQASDVAGGGMASFIGRCRTNKRLPWVSTKLPATWDVMASGAQDAWFVSLKNVIAGFNPWPVWVCLHHEPRNENAPGGSSPLNTPAAYVAMYAHGDPILHTAPNLAVTPILNGVSFAPIGGDPDPSIWYIPSADIIAYDNYNQWWCYDSGMTDYGGSGKPPGPQSVIKWKTPAAEFGDAANTIAGWGKPTAVAEWGCHFPWKEPTKAAVFMDASYDYCLNTAPHMAMSWFNSGQNSPRGPWYLDKYKTPQLPNPPSDTLYTNMERYNKFAEHLARPGTYYLS